MPSKQTILSAMAAMAATTVAQTPEGFIPGTETPLIVSFNNIGAMNGTVIDRTSTQEAPTIALFSAPPTPETLVLVAMIDIDVPIPSTPPTVLHWLQTNLTLSADPITLNLTTGSDPYYVLENPNSVPALSPYLGPAPPAMNPLSHRYVEIVIDMSGITAEGMAVLEAAAGENRLGFDAEKVFDDAGLLDEALVLGGNFFNVTNPGPATQVMTMGEIDGPAPEVERTEASGTGSVVMSVGAVAMALVMGMVM